jgi:transposase
VKRGKTDAADAEAICEAVTRPTMRSVPIKTTEEQGALLLHRARDLLVRQRTMLINALRGHMAEFGVVAPCGAKRVDELVALLMGEEDAPVPPLARRALRALAGELHALEGRIAEADAAVMAWHKGNEASRRLAAVPGVGPITASAIVATVGDASRFRSARHFAAWLGLAPKQKSSGGKERQGGISKAGNPYLRRLLVVGATAVIRHAGGRPGETPSGRWAKTLGERRPARLVSVALANKAARIAWALLARGGIYRGAASTPAAA